MNRDNRRWSPATIRLVSVEVFLAGVLLLLASGVVAQSTAPHKARAAGRYSVAAAQQATHTVSFTCCQYTASNILIQSGDTIQWNGAFVSHPLVSEDSLWSTVSAGRSFSYTFNAPGIYRYYCDFHGAPGGVGMSGTVTVVVNHYLPSVFH